MNPNFETLRKSSKKLRPKVKLYSFRLPITVGKWIEKTARMHQLTQAQVVNSIFLAGISLFEKEQPLGKKSA